VVEEHLCEVSNFLRAVKELFAPTGKRGATSATVSILSESVHVHQPSIADFDVVGAA